MTSPFALAVHGGAGRIADERARDPGRAAYDAAIARALAAGAAVLGGGGAALEAVLAAVVVLEDDELFNAGRGAALCADGSVELSASVMDGATARVGGAVGLRRTRNPVLAAAALLDHSHCLLFGERADAFAERAGLETASEAWFRTLRRDRQWQALRDRSRLHLDHNVEAPIGEDAHGTVGAVARDREGRLAAATSTGGMLNQLPGRVGDSPVAGAGTWAGPACAVSATGTGDAFFRVAFARRVADLVELAGLSAGAAAERALGEVRALGGEGGCVLVDASGRVSAAQESPHLVRGWLVEGEPPSAAIGPDDARTVAL